MTSVDERLQIHENIKAKRSSRSTKSKTLHKYDNTALDATQQKGSIYQ
jgi:hypothetical protein